MPTKRDILLALRTWAARAGLVADGKGYLPCVEDNLFRPMSPGARTTFDRGSGSELKDRNGVPAKMRAVHSSSALAVNVFDYWSEAFRCARSETGRYASRTAARP